MPKRNESDLIERAKTYEEAALSELYWRHAEAIFRYIHYRISDQIVAEDLVSEVFVRALEALPGYQDSGRPFVAWLYRIAHARVVDHYRRQQVRKAVPLDEHLLADEWTNPEQLIDKRVNEQQVRKALADLTDEQQQVISFRFMAQYSVAEVAQIMGKTEGAIKALQHRGLAALRRLLDKD